MTEGVQLINARGVPGGAGALVRSPDRPALLLTTHHVAFGRGAAEGDVLWARPDSPLARPEPVGRTLRGRIGRVDHDGKSTFVDCALVELEEETGLSPRLAAALDRLPRLGPIARAGARACVTKTGPASGVTEGVVVDAAHHDRPFVGGRSYEAPGQMLVAPARAGELFSAPGDSGAALLDAAGRIVGLMWGWSASGEGMACPIGPVVAALGLAEALA
jgi:S1-C subfamily serine protease